MSRRRLNNFCSENSTENVASFFIIIHMIIKRTFCLETVVTVVCVAVVLSKKCVFVLMRFVLTSNVKPKVSINEKQNNFFFS